MQQYVVEAIRGKKIDRRKKKTCYLVKWEGYDSDQNTWEPTHNLKNCWNLIQQFEEKQKHLDNTSYSRQNAEITENPGSKSRNSQQRTRQQNQNQKQNKSQQIKFPKKQNNKGQTHQPMQQQFSSSRQDNERPQLPVTKKLRERDRKLEDQEISKDEVANVRTGDLEVYEQQGGEMSEEISGSRDFQDQSFVVGGQVQNRERKRDLRSGLKNSKSKGIEKKNTKNKARRIKRNIESSNQELSQPSNKQPQPQSQSQPHPQDNLTKFLNNVLDLQNSNDHPQPKPQLPQKSEPKVEVLEVLGLRRVEGELSFFVEAKGGRTWVSHAYMMENYLRELCLFYERHIDFAD